MFCLSCYLHNFHFPYLRRSLEIQMSEFGDEITATLQSMGIRSDQLGSAETGMINKLQNIMTDPGANPELTAAVANCLTGIDPESGDIESIARATKALRDILGEGNERGEKGPRVGRNEPCPCGSGVKSKKCCNKN